MASPYVTVLRDAEARLKDLYARLAEQLNEAPSRRRTNQLKQLRAEIAFCEANRFGLPIEKDGYLHMLTSDEGEEQAFVLHYPAFVGQPKGHYVVAEMPPAREIFGP
jgi:hypothetical protein